MKTISKRFLKGGLAVLLAVIMLFSSCITGFAAVVDNADTKANVDVAETSATTRYIYVGISNNYYQYKDNSSYGFNFWGGSNGGVKSGTYLTSYTWDGRKYYMYRVQVSDDNTKAQFKGNNNWWDPGDGFTVKLNGTTNNAVFFSHSNDGWQGQFQQNYQETSTGKLTASATSTTVGTAVTLTPSLSSNATYNQVKSTTYKINPTSGASISGNTFTATAAGTYTVTATITYNPKYFTGITKTCTATTTITVTQPKYSYTVTAGAGGTATPASGEVNQGSSVNITATPNDGYEFAGWETTNGAVDSTEDASTTFRPSANGANAHATFTPADYTVTLNANGGTINSGNVTGYTHGTAVTLPTNVTKEGHTFSGWYDNPSLSGTAVTQIPSNAFGNKTYYAKWNVNKYTITINQNVAGGTTVVNGTTVSGTTGTVQLDYNTTATVTVTPTGNYKISAISGAVSSGESTSAVTNTFTVTTDATINVNYVLAGSCSVSFAKGNATQQLVIGGTYTNTASVDDTYCTGNKSVTYSSNATSVATVNSNGVVTAVAPGTATITATCPTDKSTATYQVTVLEPTLTFDEIVLDVNGSADADDFLTVGNAPSSTYTVTYTTSSSDITVTSAGVITAKAPTTGATVTATITVGSWSKSVTFPVVVNTPTINFNPKAFNLLTGQTMDCAFEASANVGNPTITITSGDTDVMTLSNNVGTAVAQGSTTVTATFEFNDTYSVDATCNVRVVDPAIYEAPTEVALEYYADGDADTESTTFTLTSNASDSDVDCPAVTVATDNADVATAEIDANGKVTVTATGTGTANITATFLGAEVTIPVTVTQYDPYNYFYFTNNWAWTDCYAHIYVEGGSASYDLTKNAYHLVKIGKNQDGQDVYAGRILKTQANATHIIFSQSAGTWPSNYYRTNGIAFNFSQYNAFYCSSRTSDEKITVGTWTFVDSTPTVSVEGITIGVGETGTLTATQTGDYTPSSYTWTADNENVSFGTVSGNTVPVTGAVAGTSEVTVRAFAYTSTATADKTSLKSLYTTSEDAWPYISSTATAKVNVTETYYNVAFDAEYTDNGSGFTAGNNGGTVSYDGDASVPHGTSITATATPADGYRFLGWYANDELVNAGAEYTFNVTADTALTARFIKQYTVTVNLGDGIDLVKVNNTNFAENGTLTVDAGADFTAYATPADEYKFKNWTITGATVADDALASITVSNVQSDVTITANAAPVFSATATAHTNYGASGGNATVGGTSFEVGDDVTFTAVPATTYYFAGWYTDATYETLVSENATYTTEMLETGLDLHALFVKDIYINGAQLTYDIDSDSYTLENATYSDTFTIKDDHNSNLSGVTVPAQQTGATVSGDATNGYTVDADLINYYTDTVTYELTSAGNGTYTLALTLVEKPKYKVYLGEKDEENLIGEYAVDAPVEFVDTPAYGKYINNISSEPAIRDLAADMTTNTITFTMPDEVVIVKPAYGNLASIVFSNTVGLDFTGASDDGFYLPGSSVEITVAPRGEQVTINNMTANGGTVTNNDDGTFTLTVTPTDGQQIYVELDVDAQFAMNYGVKAIGDYGTGSTETDYGTVTMTKADDTEIEQGTYVDNTDAITYTAVAGENYIFDGFYSEPTCSILNIITRDSTYTVNPDEDTTVYALFVRRQYIAYNYNNTSDNNEMTYDAKTRSFSIVSPSISQTAWFRVTNDINSWNDSKSYCQYDSTFSVTFNMTSYGVEVGWGTQCWALSNASSNVNQSFTFILTIDENKSVDISARAQKSGNTAYLSYGRNDIVPAVSTVIDETGLTVNKTAGTSRTDEKYITINSDSNYSLSFQTQLTGDTAGDFYIDKFVVYHIDTKLYSIVEPNPLGNNTYSGSVYVDGDVYIVPIFFHTEQYAIDNDLVEIDLYFDATAVNKNTWGPFVGAYAYGTDETSELFYNGTWPGQMMIPSEDGTSFYTMVTVPSADAENSDTLIQGFLFSNYMMNSVPQANAGAFGVYDAQVQTYDYKEPITLYQEGVEVITFTAKNSTDGYHGDSASVTNNVHNPITATDINLEDYHFKYLYNRDGVTPMDFYTDDITNPKNLNTAGADYYVVTRGDVPYGEYSLTDSNVKLQGSTYGADENFEGEWAVDWYVFDRNGKYITHVLSDALFNEGLENDDAPYLVELLSAEEGQPVSNYKGKTVAISYEAPNKDADNHHQIAYDGQWYGNMLEDLVKGNVIVGLQDDDGKVSIKTDEPDNEAYYGNGYIIDTEGDGTPKGEVEITMNYGEANLTATPAEGYRFVGWHTYVQGEYIKISAAPVYNSYINMNTTYYAIFKAIGEDEIVINHMTYDNPDDPYIPSHGGVSNMHVQVYNNASGALVTEGIVSNSISTAVFEVIPNVDEYRVVITTTPLMGGSFYAWYTDSTDADGNPTYEEILVEEGMVGSETTVTSEFVYVVENGAPRIVNIYSDIKRVTSYADIVYKYYNRFGEVRTYTVKDVALTDDECDGYIGNKSNPYCPTFNTQYVVENKAGEQETIYGEDQLAEYVANGYEAVSSYNGIHKWAPSHEVTEAIDEIISWTVTEVNLEIDKSYVVVWADQDPISFKITALKPDGSIIAEKEGPYNTLAEGIEAPKTYDGKEFSYWIDNVTGEILSYLIEYNYRIVEDKTIMAVYGADVADWTPVIDSVTYTREFQDTTDYVYSDFLITFNSSKDEELDVMKAENPGSVKYGLIMVRDADYLYDGGAEKLYPDNADIIDVVTARAGESSYRFEVNKNDKTMTYNAYCYDLTNYDSTNFNRMEYYVRYDNKVEKYRKYTFTAYVYLIVDGVKYISRPENVSIYDEAVKSYLQ